jgi:hypothetical protein
MCLEAEQEAGPRRDRQAHGAKRHAREGDIVVCGAGHGRVKAMFDTLRPRQKIKEAGPSTPVNVTGLDVAPNAGDRFYVLSDIAQARELAANEPWPRGNNRSRAVAPASRSRISSSGCPRAAWDSRPTSRHAQPDHPGRRSRFDRSHS